MDVLGIVLLTQRRHGEILLEAAAHYTGDAATDIVAVSLLGNESRAEIKSRLDAAVSGFGARGVLVLCDLFGSTHAAIACEMARRERNIACICGLNLAMLMEAQTARNRPLSAAAARIAKAARQSVVCGKPQ